MHYPPVELSTARVLVANDDGINAKGLTVLERAMSEVAREVWVVAPEHEQSAASHSLTMRRPLFIREIAPRRFTVDGTPTDCVLLAVHQIMKDDPPDVVVSGVNHGGNLGEDAIYSGTVAAAMEGTLLGIPSVAFSQVYTDERNVPWETAAAWIGQIMVRLQSIAWSRNVMINVNFPAMLPSAVTGIEVTRQGKRKIGSKLLGGSDPRGRAYFWIGATREEDCRREGTDLEASLRGAITLTPLSLDLTDEATLQVLRTAFP